MVVENYELMVFSGSDSRLYQTIPSVRNKNY